jgi:hypothetical protein
LAQDPSGQGAAAGQSTTGALVTQALTMVVSIALVLGVVYMVVVLARGGSLSPVYSFLADLSVLGVVAGVLAGYMAEYRLVTRMVQSLGTAAASVVLLFTFAATDSTARLVAFGVSMVAGFASALPRIAEAATAAVMLVVTLFVFEATRRGYLFVWTIVAAPAFMTAAALLLGNAFAEAFAPPPPPDGANG